MSSTISGPAGSAASHSRFSLVSVVVGPADGVARDGVEAFRALDAGADLVVIAANQRVRLEVAHALADGVGIGAVADQVAEQQDLVVAERLGLGHDGLEGLEVRVYVADDQVAHQVSGVQPLHDVIDELLNGAASCVHPEVRLAVGREALIIKLFHPQPIGGQRPPAVDGARAAGRLSNGASSQTTAAVPQHQLAI